MAGDLDRLALGVAAPNLSWTLDVLNAVSAELDTALAAKDALGSDPGHADLDDADSPFLRLRARAGEQVAEVVRRRSHAYEVLNDLGDWLLGTFVQDHEAAPDIVAVARGLAADLRRLANEVGRETLGSGLSSLNDWLPLIALDPSDGRVQTLEQWHGPNQTLHQRLNPNVGPNGLAVVLGPGVSQARTGPDEWIEWPAGVVDHDVGTRDFADLLRRARGGGRKRKPGEWPELPELQRLRLALIGAARTAGAAFQGSWKVEVPVTSWERHHVAFERGEETGLCDALAEASSAAADLPHVVDVNAGLELLGAAVLAGRLTRLIRLLGEGVPGERDPGILFGTEVSWLTDCAWHALIFRSPMYPDLRELTLQVELCTGAVEGPVRTLEPPATISRGDSAAIAEATARAVARGWSVDTAPDSGRRDLLDLVARRLWFEARVSEMPNPPIVVSTTFDLEMERALARGGPEGQGFHVLVPVLERVEVHGEPALSLRWLLGTCAAGPAATDLARLRRPTWQRALDAVQPTNPVVVKINGSPLHLLPNVQSASGSIVPMKAAMLLREFDSMDLTQISQTANVLSLTRRERLQLGVATPAPTVTDKATAYSALPPWMLAAMSAPDRRWLVAGARLADWNARSQLLSLLSWPTAAKGDRRQAKVWAVGKEFEQVRSEILRWLDVDLIRADCLDLIPVLEELLAEDGV